MHCEVVSRVEGCSEVETCPNDVDLDGDQRFERLIMLGIYRTDGPVFAVPLSENSCHWRLGVMAHCRFQVATRTLAQF